MKSMRRLLGASTAALIACAAGGFAYSADNLEEVMKRRVLTQKDLLTC